MNEQIYYRELNAGKILLEMLASILLSTVPLLVSTSSMLTLNQMVIFPLLNQTENSQPQISRLQINKLTSRKTA